MNPVRPFMLGLLVMACLVAGMFFMRFWRRTGDRLFGLFAIALFLLGTNWLLLACTSRDETRDVLFYLLRLLAFVLILVGIVDKNRAQRKK